MREASSVRLSAFCKVRLRREAQKGLCVIEAVSVPPAIQHHQLPHHLRVLQQLQRHVSHLATAGAGYIHGRRAMGTVLEMREGSASDMHGGAEAEGMTSHVPQPRPRLARLIEHVHQLRLGHRHACSHRGKAGPHRLSSGPYARSPGLPSAALWLEPAALRTRRCEDGLEVAQLLPVLGQPAHWT